MIKTLLFVALCCLFLQSTLQQDAVGFENLPDNTTLVSGTWATSSRSNVDGFRGAFIYNRKSLRYLGCRQYDCSIEQGRIAQCVPSLEDVMLAIAGQIWIAQQYEGRQQPSYCFKKKGFYE